jgi:hypothetical protein
MRPWCFEVNRSSEMRFDFWSWHPTLGAFREGKVIEEHAGAQKSSASPGLEEGRG